MNGREGEESGRALGAQLDEGCMEEKGGTWSKIPKYKSWHFHLLAVTSNTLFNLCKSLLSRMSRRCINIVHMCREIIIYAKQIHVFFVQKNYSSGPLSISEPNGGLLPAKSGILGIYCCIKKKNLPKLSNLKQYQSFTRFMNLQFGQSWDRLSPFHVASAGKAWWELDWLPRSLPHMADELMPLFLSHKLLDRVMGFLSPPWQDSKRQEEKAASLLKSAFRS